MSLPCQAASTSTVLCLMQLSDSSIVLLSGPFCCYSMKQWKLSFLVLLSLSLCTDSEGRVQLLFTLRCSFLFVITQRNYKQWVQISRLVTEVVVKTTREREDVTPVCSPAALHLITLVVCKISTENSRGRECRLLYGPEDKFENGCDSRFTLRTETQVVFLHLTDLTPRDSGNYSCECSHIHGTDFLHLSITVEGKCVID